MLSRMLSVSDPDHLHLVSPKFALKASSRSTSLSIDTTRSLAFSIARSDLRLGISTPGKHGGAAVQSAHGIMPRKKPFSAKQRKAQLLDKRAHKRGEDVDGISAHASGSTRAKTQSRTELRPSSRPQRSGPGDETSTRLQSKFIALTPAYLDQTRNLAYSTVLTRPIEANTAVFPVEELLRGEEGLKCPGRPKFKFGQTKKEVERNEEGMFKKWLQATEQVVHDYVEGAEDDEGAEVRSPTWFETNLEVWRQL